MPNQYATVADLQKHVDNRLLERLSSDSGSDEVVDENNEILTSALQAASADVDSHVRVGKRYSQEDLDRLNADDDQTLVRLVCSRALVYLYGRRGGEIPEAAERMMEIADNTLKELRNGQQVFATTTAVNAGKGELVVVPSHIRTGMNLHSDSQFFPQRRTRTW